MNAPKEFCYSEQLRQNIRYSYGYIGINIQEKPYSPKDQLRGLICCATLLKVTHLHGCCSCFLNCINAIFIMQITYESHVGNLKVSTSKVRYA